MKRGRKRASWKQRFTDLLEDSTEDDIPEISQWEIFLSHSPEIKSESLVNNKKINELEYLLAESISKPSVIIINGPSGCGKTSLLKLLCRDRDVDIVEWSYIESLSTIDENNEKGCFEDFFKKNMFPSLDSLNNSKVFLVKDIPNVYYDKTNQLIELLTNARKFLFAPIIFIFDHEELSKRICKYLTENLQNFFKIHTISFNPITNKVLVKFFGKMKQNLNSTQRKLLTSNLVENLAVSANGDIRKFINIIRFFLMPTFKKETLLNKLTLDASLSLSLFHAVGKILYCKRLNKSDQELLPIDKLFLYRLIAADDIKNVMDNMECDTNVFVSSLFENTHKFITELNDLEEIYDELCAYDVAASLWTVQNCL